MTNSANPANPATPSAPTAPNPVNQPTPPPAYNHPKLQELLKKAGGTPGIGQLICQTVYDTVHPQDRILACYYQFEASVGSNDMGAAFYSCDLVLITSAYFITVGFYPKLHTIHKRRVYSISDLKVEYQSPSSEDLKRLAGAKFYPSNLSVVLSFVNERGDNLDTWSVEVTQPDSIRSLYDTTKLLAKCIGIPLAQIPAMEAGK